jgi:hypothetical protein
MPALVKKKAAAKTREFTLVLTGVPKDSEVEAFYGICQDATVAVRGDTARVHFHRDAKSLEAALQSALTDAQSAGMTVARVELAPEVLQ